MILIVLITFLTVFYILYQVKFYNRNKILRQFPSPKRLPILHNAHYFLNKSPIEIFDWLYDMSKELGSVYAFTLDPFDDGTFVVTDPEVAEAILKSQKLIDKGFDYNLVKPWLGDGLLISTGKKWQQRRKIITPAFHFQILEKFVDIMSEHGEILLKKLEKFDSQEIDIYPLINLYALDVICESAMGYELNAQNKESEYTKTVKLIGELVFLRSFDPVRRIDFFYQFTSMYRQQKKYLQTLHGFTNDVIRKRREESKNESDQAVKEDIDGGIGAKKRMALLDLLLKSTMEGKPLTDSDIREEVDTFMFEGHDTTTSGIVFCLYNIAKYPDIQKKIFEEIQNAEVSKFDGKHIHELSSYRYLEMVIKESLRLYPSVPYFARRLSEEFSVKGYTFPIHSSVYLSPYIMGRNEEIFENALEFNPERFDAETTNETMNYYSYVPFSAGPRNCIGQKFAMLEMKSIVSKIIRKFEISLPKNCEDLQIYSSMVLASQNGVKIHLKMR